MGYRLITRGSVCRIEVMEGAAEGPDYGYPSEAPTLALLGRAPDDATDWLPLVMAWAKAPDHAIYREAGKWTRVGVSAAAVLDFLRSVLGETDARTVALQRQIDPRNKYIIVVAKRVACPAQG
jgi:hypothetical protein